MSNANEPAYPVIETRAMYDRERNFYADTYSTGGLTKREYFAGLAMQGMLADHTCDAEPDKFAEVAVNYADALLAALERAA